MSTRPYDDLPPARRRGDPGKSGYAGVWVKKMKSRKNGKVYWYFAVRGIRDHVLYFPYTQEGLAAALQKVEEVAAWRHEQS